MNRLLATLLLAAAPGAAANSNPFTAPAVPPRYADVRAGSQYISMADGVRLAVDVLLPKDLPAGTKLPAILKITRYGRAAANGSVSAFDRFWVTHGFARVLIDERGTGASFGTVRYGRATLGDLRQMVDWVVGREWSNGRVGAIGNSYEGTTAELVAACGHPAVRAVMPLFSDFNYYTDLLRPGGVFNDWLLRTWGTETRAMDSGEGAKRVDADADGALLKRAVAQHAANPDIYAAGSRAEYMDDTADAFGSYGDLNNAGVGEEMEQQRVPMLVFDGWLDAGTAQGSIRRFETFPNPQRLYIGPWSHGAGHHADPFAPSEMTQPTAQQRLYEALQFFDRHLNGTSEAANEERRIDYVTLGENVWKSTRVWPPAGYSTRFYYLGERQALLTAPGKSSADISIKAAATGEQNRWHSQLTGNNVDFSGALPQMQALAGFTSDPLDQTAELTGQPILRIKLRPSCDDPTLLAYLLAIEPHGRPIYLTEGQLRLLHRKPDAAEQTLHSYRRVDALPAKAGEEMEAAVTLLPLSALLPKGYRLRVLLASSDGGEFPGSPPYTAVIDGSSRLELPMAVRKDAKLAYPAAEAEHSTAASKSRPDFSGTWKLNLADSDFSDKRASHPDSLVRTVKQTGDALQYSVERRQGGRAASFHVGLRIGGPRYESDAAGVVSATWEGDTLVVKTLFNPGTERQGEQVERWTLARDGKRVTEALWVKLPDGTEVRIRRVFDRE